VAKNGSSTGLVRRLTRNLLITIGLLLFVLILDLGLGIAIINNQRSRDDGKAEALQDVDTILTAMLNQETGVRAYVSTTDPVFLDPYNQGRNDFLSAYADLQKSFTIQPNYKTYFKASSDALEVVKQKSDAWYQNFGQQQIQFVQAGGDSLRNARLPARALEGKGYFDQVRSSTSDLKTAVISDYNALQDRVNGFNLTLLIISIVMALGAVIIIWRSFGGFIRKMQTQLDQIMGVTDRLEDGDLTARIENPSNDELGRLATNFNSMAASLESQQNALRQQDIQQSLLVLNNALTTSLALEPMLDQFLLALVNELQLQVGAIYLFNKETELLTLYASQGLDKSQLQTFFSLGEGMSGRVAQTRQPLILDRPDTPEARGFVVKTLMGEALPATLYHLPLAQGDDFFGVISAGTLYPMNEKIRNVLSVITGNLAVAISNSQAYLHIQSQAEELERRQRELQRSNTELSRQRDELSILNSALEQANRTRSQFLSTMSHELRTPLTAIIGFSQLSLRGSEVANLSKRQKSNLERVLKNGQHLLNLVNDVLDIAKIEAGRMDISHSQLELEPFMNSIIEQTQSLATEKGLKFTAKVDDNIGTVETDADKLRQILINLISNAIKFTHTGEVTLTAYLDPDGPEGFKTGKEWIAITVKDTGIGIPLEKQAQIFEEFYQVDNSSTRNYGGTGLGLSIVRKLTELLEGKLKLESQPGAGSSFTILLPRKPTRVQVESLPLRPTLFSPILVGEPDNTVLIASQPTETPNGDTALDQALQASRDLGKKLVVSIDDDQDVVDLIQHALEGTVYHVVGLSEPTRALSIITRLRPYAVTLDVMMPQSNGWQVLQQLKSEPATASIPVIMLSVVADRSAGFVLGANEYLVKPIDRDLLLRTLDRLTRSTDEEVASLELVASGEPGKSGPNENGSRGVKARDVLVVDDEPDIRNVLEQAISEAGYTVRTAAGGLEALRLMSQAQPGVILLDLMMPDMDGFEVLQRIRGNPLTSQIPVVVLTAKILTAQDYERLQRDANQIIQKGSRPLEEILDELQTLLTKAS